LVGGVAACESESERVEVVVKLYGAQRMVLQALLDAQGQTASFIEDNKIAQATKIVLVDAKMWLETLEEGEYINLARTEAGLSASITAKGRLVLDEAGEPPKSSRPTKVVPKGLRSFDEKDKDFFLELLPGPRRADGLPESVHFWKVRIEEMDPDKTFRVGYIFGPSGCGKSSLVKAGLLPRLSESIIRIYIEAAGEETEAKLLRELRKKKPELPPDLDLRTTLAAARETIQRGSNKILLVIDQFEQWYHAKGAEPETELAKALRECDGGRVQAIIMVRDDFSMALHRFVVAIGVTPNLDLNFAVVDLFDLRHARRVLVAFGRGYGALPDDPRGITNHHKAFLDQAITELSQEGRVISVRLALFAEMLKGKPWTPETLKQIGGTERVGVTFLEETFSAKSAPPSYRTHQKAAQSVLKALLPEIGSNIKGNMRSYRELLGVSGYGSRPNEFDELIRVLDTELRLISPTDPEGSESEGPTRPQMGEKFYLLTHDYLVPSLREWLTSKQRETRRGRAELRLAERAAVWHDKSENRFLPSAWEWAKTWLLTERKDWTEPQKKMMRRAGRVHGVQGALALAILTAGVLVAIAVRRQFIENQKATHAAGLVQRVLDADTLQVPDIVRAMRDYRQWVDSLLRSELAKRSDDPRQKLHASLALLPVDASQVDYLFNRLLSATPGELAVLRAALKTHRSTLTPKLWTVLESAKPGDASLLPAASALASYASDDGKWEAVGGKVALELVSLNSLLLRSWIEALRPVRGKLTAPLAKIFQEKSHSESVHSLATDILTDYASDDPDRLAELLKVSDPKAYRSLFPIAEKWAEQIVPVFQDELAQNVTYSWNDPPLDPSWTKPDATLASRVEAAQGMVAEQFAYCQTMPLVEFLATAEALRKSGYHPIRFRPYANQGTVRVSAVWTRDGQNWRSASGLSPEQIRQQDEKNRNDKFLPMDVAGYVTTGPDGQPGERYAAVWVERTGDDEARMYIGTTADEETQVQDELKEATLIPRTQNAMIGPDGRPRYCGVWGRPARADITGQAYGDEFEGSFEQKQADMSDQLLIDVAVNGASKPQPTRERAQADLQSAEQKLKTNPDDLDSRLARAVANFRLGENQKALDDLQVVRRKHPEAVSAEQYRIIALARLGKKQDAKSDLEKFQKGDAPAHSKLYLAAVVAAELGEGANKALEALEAAIGKQPTDADMRYDAARAFSLASKAISRSDESKGRQLAERCLQLLREAIKNDDADIGAMDEDADLDPIRDDPAFAEIMKIGHSDRRVAAVWTSDASCEATSIYGVDPAAQTKKCRELIAQGYRPVSWSVSETTPEGTLVTASVWHRPVITEETRDRLAERQARAAVALLRMGRAGEIMHLLRHSADPRLRSFIVNWLNPLGAVPKLIVAELDRIDPNARPTPAQGQQLMDIVLFQPETSQRRALILALGTYGTEGLSTGERETLTAKLLDLYRNDPDSGIHGAAEWALRQWKQQEKLKELDAELIKVTDWGKRRWYLNGQGQTFAVIEGPVTFEMGSPPTETERIAGTETRRHMRIPRRFAIAAKEVTVEQFRRFLKRSGITIERYHVSASFLSRYGPDPQGPWIGPDWYTAAHYCNWLSEQDRLPKDQWCYLPNDEGAYADGMSIPADVLERTGYRLPTEAEWEYACRAGAVTSRCYGHSVKLLDAYARYQANSSDHAWTCGSLFSNDLGLFDMLGNMLEWCQDSNKGPKPGNKAIHDDIITTYESVIEKNRRLVRGGSCGSEPALVRSALRVSHAPSYRFRSYGFRPARTYH